MSGGQNDGVQSVTFTYLLRNTEVPLALQNRKKPRKAAC